MTIEATQSNETPDTTESSETTNASDAPKRAPRAKRSTAPAPILSPARGAAAYHRVLPSVLAGTDTDGPAPEIEPAAAARHVLAALPRIRALRDEIAAMLPARHVEIIEALEDLALAAWFAHARGEIVGDAQFSLESLETRALALREELLVAADVLARRDLLDPTRVRTVREGTNTSDCAQDLQTLADLYTWSWGTVHNKTAVTQEEIAEAGELAQRIFVARGLREEAAAGAGAVDVAPKMLARLARAYDECVRAVSYVRWREGDVAEVCPPLAPKRKRATKNANGQTVPPPPSSSTSPSDDAIAPAAEITAADAS